MPKIQLNSMLIIIAEREARQLIVLHGDPAYVHVCMYACIYVHNATGMQLLTYFLWAWHCFDARAVEPRAL